MESLSSIEDEISAVIESNPELFLQTERNNLTSKACSGQLSKIRKDQVPNNTGGYVFVVTDETRVRRYLILGTSSSTYYVDDKKLTFDNIQDLKDIIHRGKASLLLREIKEISLAGRNPKQQPLMMALALCARYKVMDMCHPGKDISPLYAKYIQHMHKEAFALVHQVCRIPTHLFMFVEYCKKISAETGMSSTSRGWGRMMRATVSNWYKSKSPETLAMLMTKYVSREGWSHRDLLRLAHPEPSEGDNILVYDDIFFFATHGTLDRKVVLPKKRRNEEKEVEIVAPKKVKHEKIYTTEQEDARKNSSALQFLRSLEALKHEASEEIIVEAIQRYGMVREQVPTEHLNSVKVWKALLEKMPMTALIRNLAKMESIGVVKQEVEKIISHLRDADGLKKARIHPIQVLLAKAVYDSGKGEKGKLTWIPNDAVSAALEWAFYASFINLPPTNKRICLAFDVSGSMMSKILGTSISARTASAAMGLSILQVEDNVECVGFCDKLVELPYRKGWTLKKVLEHMNGLPFGATDCALPMTWAQRHEKKFDVFVVFTDCETNYGEVHPFAALQSYREASGIDARLVVCGMTATQFTIADPSDSGMLDIVGFDSAVPELITNFIEGKL